MRVLVVEWDAATAEVRAEALRGAGHEVRIESEDGARAYKTVGSWRPDVVVLGLETKPSHSWQTARPLSGRVRLLFVGGDDRATTRAREVVPAAEFITEADLLSALSP